MKSNNPRPPVPRIGQGKAGVAGHPTYLLRQAAGALRGAMDRAFAPVGMTYPPFLVLVMLDADLARLSQLTPQTLTVITRNLVAAGLIRRGSSVGNQRVIPYELTDTGHVKLGNCRRAAVGLEAGLFEGFSAAEIATVKRWLVEVAKRLHVGNGNGVERGA